MRRLPDSDPAANIDWFIFIASVIVVFAVCIPLGMFPEAGAVVLDDAFTYVTEQLGIGYILFSIGAIGLLVFLAFSRFGRIVLGGSGRPDFRPSAGLQCCSAAASAPSVLYWGTIEWAHYYQSPPMGLPAESPKHFNGQLPIRFSTGGSPDGPCTACRRLPLPTPITFAACPR